MANVCTRCDEQLSKEGDIVTCKAGCKKEYHIQCTGLSVNSYARMSEKKREAWICLNCREEKKRKEKMDEVEDIMDKRGCSQIIEVSADSSLLIQLNNNVLKLTDEMKDLKKSVQFISNQYDKLLEEVIGLKVIKATHEVMSNKIVSLENRVNELEQYSRGRNIEIKGVEESPNENLKQVVVKIANKLGEAEITEKDIDIVHRVGNMNNRSPKDIIVQFKDRESRNKMLSKKKRRVVSSEVTGGRNDDTVYLNEHLTPFNKQLFWEAKIKSKECNYRFVWSKDGKIFVRKNEKDRAYRIRNEEDLKKIV